MESLVCWQRDAAEKECLDLRLASPCLQSCAASGPEIGSDVRVFGELHCGHCQTAMGHGRARKDLGPGALSEY